MQQQYLRYGLIAGVILIWGLILVRIASSLIGDESVVKKKVTTFTYQEDIEPETKFTLYLNYPDPFIPETDTVASESYRREKLTYVAPNPQQVSNSASKAVGAEDVAFIVYRGMIYNPTRKLKAALISVHTKDLTLKEKETADGITIKKISTDKIQIYYHKKNHIIFRN